MRRVLVLGAARSGIGALQHAVAAAAGVPLVTMMMQFGLLHRVAQAMKSHGDAVAGVRCDAASKIDMQPLLSRFWDMLLEEQQQGTELSDVVIGAADVLSDCPNIKSAAALMALDTTWRVLAVQRHPVDFISSRLRACHPTAFATHCSLWSNMADQLSKLKKVFDSRVLVLDHSDLFATPEKAANSVAAFLHLGTDAGRTIAPTLVGNRLSRTATFRHAPVLRLADTSWSAPEISLFRFMCESQAAASGYTLDCEGVEQTRPLDLVRAITERAHFSGAWAAQSADADDIAPQITCGNGDGAAGSMRLGPVSAGRRRQLRSRFVAKIGEGERELQFDIIESLSRRPIFGRSFVLRHDEDVECDIRLPSHDGLLDFVFSGGNARAPLAFQFRHASLSIA